MYRLHYSPSSASMAPHMMLREIGAPFELVLTDIQQGANFQPGYLALNPTGKIPTLLDGDLVLTESAAICLHLADRHPEAGLAPALGTAERAQLYRWLVHMTNTLQPDYIAYFYPKRQAGPVDEVKAKAEARVALGMDLMERQLADMGAPFLFGEKPGAADFFLFMMVRWSRNMSRPARTLPRLGRLAAAVAARPSAQAAFAAEGLVEPLF